MEERAESQGRLQGEGGRSVERGHCVPEVGAPGSSHEFDGMVLILVMMAMHILFQVSHSVCVMIWDLLDSIAACECILRRVDRPYKSSIEMFESAKASGVPCYAWTA